MFLIDQHVYCHRAQSGNVLLIKTEECPSHTSFKANWKNSPSCEDGTEAEFVFEVVREDIQARKGSDQQFYLL